MTHNLLYRIPDNIYQRFFCAKVLLNRLPSEINAEPADSQSSSEESEQIENSYEYYLEYNTESAQSNNVDGIMITRSAWKKINRDLPIDCQIPAMAPIPKIIIKKKSKKVSEKITENMQPSNVVSKANEPANITPSSVDYAKNPKKRRRQPVRLDKRKHIRKVRAPTVVESFQLESFEDTSSIFPNESATNYKAPSEDKSARTAETGYSSAADSTTNEALAIPIEEISKPILNYTLIPKPKKGRHTKSCCLDFVILPPTEPISPSKMKSNSKLPRGRPRKRAQITETSKQKTKGPAVEKKTYKKYASRNKLLTPVLSPLAPKEPVIPGKSLPIIEGPPTVPRAAWIKKRIMAEDIMCRIPLSKISRIPRVIKIQMPQIIGHRKAEQQKPRNDNSQNVALPQPEPEPDKIEQPPIILGMASADVIKGTSTIEAINDWFVNDLDLSSLNETNYNETNMVLEEQYFRKSPSLTSTPCSNQPTQPIESYMTEKLATETLPDISFGSTLFNYAETAESLVTPVKQQPPIAPENFPKVNNDRYNIPVNVIDFETKPQILDFSFKRPFNKHIFQINDSIETQYIDSPALEPLDLSIRKDLSQNSPIYCNQSKYASSLSPQAGDDVLLLDASYRDIDSTPNHNSSSENYSSPLDQQQMKNDKINIFLNDMDAMVQEQDQSVRSNSTALSRDPCPSNLLQSKEDIRKSKIFSELNKITRTIRINECTSLPQPEHTRQLWAPPIVERQPCLQYNGNLSFDRTSVKHRVLKIFGFPCFRFLSGKCVAFPCKFSHNYIEPRILQAVLSSEPIFVIEKCFDLVIQYDQLFIRYFESFCVLFGKSQRILTLIIMIKHCERGDRPIGFYRHVITGLGFCKLDKVTCYMTLVKNVGLVTPRSIDVLIEIMLEMDLVLKFTEKLEEFLKVDSYRINIDLFDRMLRLGERTRDSELIRILLETINNYPNDYQKRLNSVVLTQFLQMVSSLKGLD